MRPLDFTKVQAQKDSENNDPDSNGASPQGNARSNAYGVPPRFADEDMEKWMTKKFAGAINERLL